MSSILKIQNMQLFVSLLRAFAKKQQVTMEIDLGVFRILSLDPPYVYLSFENDLFTIDIPIEFTIRLDELLKNIQTLDTFICFIDSSFRLVAGWPTSCSACSLHPCPTHLTFIDIPLITPIKSYYMKQAFTTRAIVNKNCIKNMLDGTVTYHHSNGKLLVEKYSPGMNEIIEIDADFLECGYLDFFCSNSWVEHAMCFYDQISTLMFCFSDDLLSLRFAIKESPTSYLEIQVRSRER